jgi:hypothetical protein
MYGSVDYLHCPMAVLILALMLWGLTPSLLDQCVMWAKFLT